MPHVPLIDPLLLCKHAVCCRLSGQSLWRLGDRLGTRRKREGVEQQPQLGSQASVALTIYTCWKILLVSASSGSAPETDLTPD